MAKGADYRIKKIEKGPLQRFKNQNLLIKKFGEIGLQIYKAITGKRTTHELRQDLGIDEGLFDQVTTYMQEAGMIELEPVSGKAKKELPMGAPEEPEAVAMQKIKPEEAPEEVPEDITLEELPEEPEEEEPLTPLEEEPAEPEEPSEIGKPKPAEKKRVKKAKKKKEPETEMEIEPFEFEEIKPVEEGEEFPEEEPPPEEPEQPEKPEEPEEQEEVLEPEDISISAIDEGYEEESDLSPVEKIINDKYGDIGLRVYALIDGQRTAEEIMRETGLTESKLVEILDFMDEQGIIKLDYPKGGGAPPPAGPPAQSFAQAMAPPPTAPPATAPPPRSQSVGFSPMIEGDESLDEARGIPSPVELPIKAPLDIVKSVQMKAKIMLKFGDKGNKIVEQIDGKNDVIDISLKLNMPLFEIADIMRFLMQSGMVIMKPLSRTDVRKKYGDDGYSVYKRYGKEGLMLYELIGKEMTIKQMAELITKDKTQIIDMFIFIHQVLGIELPIDKDVLAKQLGI